MCVENFSYLVAVGLAICGLSDYTDCWGEWRKLKDPCSTYLPQPNIVSWPIDQLHLVREEKEKHPWTTSLKCLNVGCTRVRICKNSAAAFVWGWHSIDEFGQDRGACSAQVTSQGERLRETSPRSWRDWSGLIVKASLPWIDLIGWPWTCTSSIQSFLRMVQIGFSAIWWWSTWAILYHMAYIWESSKYNWSFSSAVGFR